MHFTKWEDSIGETCKRFGNKLSTPYSYNRKEKLKSRKLIQQVFESGKAFSQFPIKIIWLLHSNTSTSPVQAAVSVGKKQFKLAVKRNRVKRLLREAYRLNKQDLLAAVPQDKRLAIFIIYIDKELPQLPLLNRKMQLALNRLSKEISEAPASNS